MIGCSFCLGPSFHPACAEQFYGSRTTPIVRVNSCDLEAVIGAQVDRIGGVQPKFTVDVGSDRTSMVPTMGAREGRFIVKPPSLWKQPRPSKPELHLPQNEHLSMCLARLVGIEVAPCALLALMDGIPVYVTKRFDRTDDDDQPGSLPLIDFCQILDLPQDRNTSTSATRCVEVIRAYSVDADNDLRRLLQLLVFSYWIGNGDLHLKNLSLLDRSGYRLSPAYDLTSTYVFGEERLALHVCNRQKDVPRRTWLAFAAACDLGEQAAAAIIDSMLARYEDCLAMIGRSGLHADHQIAYKQCLRKRRRALRAS